MLRAYNEKLKKIKNIVYLRKCGYMYHAYIHMHVKYILYELITKVTVVVNVVTLHHTIFQVITSFLKTNPGHPIEQLLTYIGGNVGFVFTNSDLGHIREVIERWGN